MTHILLLFSKLSSHFLKSHFPFTTYFHHSSYFQPMTLEMYPIKPIGAGLLNQLWIPKVSSDVQVVNCIVFVGYNFVLNCSSICFSKMFFK